MSRAFLPSRGRPPAGTGGGSTTHDRMVPDVFQAMLSEYALRMNWNNSDINGRVTDLGRILVNANDLHAKYMHIDTTDVHRIEYAANLRTLVDSIIERFSALTYMQRDAMVGMVYAKNAHLHKDLPESCSQKFLAETMPKAVLDHYLDELQALRRELGRVMDNNNNHKPPAGP